MSVASRSAPTPADQPADDGPAGRWPATAWLTRRWLRQRWTAMLPLAMLVAVGTTGSLVALGAAQRTDTAYADYLVRARVADVVINPTVQTAEIDAEIRRLPGVASIARDALFNTIVDGDGWQESTEFTGLYLSGSVDGRYTDIDLPIVREGRLPSGPAEAFVNTDLAELHGIGVGDELRVTFMSAYGSWFPERGPGDPIAVESVTVAGIGTFPGEVLPDGLYPRSRVLLSPDLAARYDCLYAIPPAAASLEVAAVVMFPRDGCSTAYSFYSVSFGGDDRSVAAALDVFGQVAAEMTGALPPALAEEGVAYRLIATTTAHERDRVNRSTQPTVAALAVLGVFAAATTLVLAGLTIGRELRRAGETQSRWWFLGVPARERGVVVIVPMLLAIVAGLLVALAATWTLSPIGPVGTVATVDPSPARTVASWSWIAFAALATVQVAGAATLTWLAARRVRPGPLRPHRAAAGARLVRSSNRPEVAEGARVALSGSGGSGMVVGAGAVGTAVFVAAAVFGAGLTSLMSTPAKYGWPWDAG